MKTETICFGDCLEHLKQWIRWNNDIFEGKPALADLIYLDPPWNSDTYYNITYESADNKQKGNTAQSTVFTDVWEWGDAAEERLQRLTKDYLSPNDPFYPLLRARKCVAGLETILDRHSMLAYLTYMAERLAMCRELLKETGSIFLHCDPTAGHYLKTLMDAIFGKENYRNDIVWSYRTGGASKKHFSRKHEYIFFYCKNHKANPTFNPQMEKSYTKAKGRKPGKINYGGGDRILRR